MKKDSMLAKLIAGISGTAPEASAPLSGLQAEFDAYRADSSKQMEEMSTALKTAMNAVAEADAKVATLQAALDVATNATVALAAEAETKRLAVRKEKIVMAVGSVKAEALMTVSATMNDADFESVVGALMTSVDTEAKSPMFTEAGATVTAQIPATNEGSAISVMSHLKNMFPQAK